MKTRGLGGRTVRAELDLAGWADPGLVGKNKRVGLKTLLRFFVWCGNVGILYEIKQYIKKQHLLDL